MANEDAIYIGELAMPMIKGEKGDKGDQGPQGEQGIQGIAGVNATIAVGSTVTGAAGTEASVENSGTASNAVLNFVVPRGDKGEKGDTGEIVSVNATTLSSTSQAYARNNGTTTDAELELGIPKGVGILDVTIDENYDVIVTLDNNTEINAGSLAELEAIKGYVEGSNRTATMQHPIVVKEWNTSGTYYLGNFVIHNSHIYKCVVDYATEGTFVTNEWEEKDLLNWCLENTTDLNELQSDIGEVWSSCELTENKVTSISSSSTDTQYPSAKAVYDATKDSITSVDYATSSVGGVFKLGNYIELDSEKRLCQTVNLDSPSLIDTSGYGLYDNVLLSTNNVRNLIEGYRRRTIDPNEGFIKRITNFPTTGAVVDYIASDYATSSNAGVIKADYTNYGVLVDSSGFLKAATAAASVLNNKEDSFIIGKGTMINYVTSVVGDINSALDAINGEEV